VFHEDWAKQNAHIQNGFLKASATAQAILADDEQEWDKIRPLMDVANDDALFRNLRRRFIDGVQQAPIETQEHDAAKLFEIVRHIGGARGTGGLEALPEGVFWRPTNG
jgi:NitT/TauT family transport system substrate-binding protein